MDEYGHDRRRDSHGPGRLRVIEVGEVPKRECSLVPGVEVVERGSDDLGLATPVDCIEVVNGNGVMEPVDGPPSAVPASAALLTEVVGQFVGRDPEYPGGESARPPAEPGQGPEGFFECGGGDIFGYLLRSGSSVGEIVDSFDIAAIQLGEAVGIAPRPLDEFTFVERVAVRWIKHRR